MPEKLTWKPDWEKAQQNFIQWWNRQGMVLWARMKRPAPRPGYPSPSAPQDWQIWWTDPLYRCQKAEYELAGLDFIADSYPCFDTQIGPGSLGTFLGSQPEFWPDTVWYNPCITQPEASPPIRFVPQDNRWWLVHLALVEEGLRRSEGRYLVGMPDLIENMDTLAALRGNTELLTDLMERPGWVCERLAEINQAFFTAFDSIHARIQTPEGGNCFGAFSIWGPGKTAKVQCDFSAMISAHMFRQFVVPYLAEQCAWLDFSLYHLDGTTALHHLEALLEIEALDAIEWTPQSGKEPGGSPVWFNLYRRIKAGGKSVQVIEVAPEQVIPLLDAIGPSGTYVMLDRDLEPEQAEQLLKSVEPYR